MRLINLTAFILTGWLGGNILFAQNQTLRVRLFEILAPQALELELTESSHAAILLAQQPLRDMIVAPAAAAMPGPAEPLRLAADSRFEIQLGREAAVRTRRPIRIMRRGHALHIQNEDFSRTLSSSDTVTVAATAGTISVAVNLRNGKRPFPPRPYAGAFEIHLAGNELCVINLVPIADYLAGVLAAELPAAPLAALQAQAVAARTYLVKNRHRHTGAGYHLCDLTHCQRYAGSAGVDSTIWRAVTSTANEILTYQNKPIEVFYSSTCGGRTADDHGVWSDVNDHVYLASVPDSSRHTGYCTPSPHFRWRWQIEADSLLQLWRNELGDAIQAIGVSKRSADGRVRELALMGQSLHLVRGEDFRAVVCRVWGWNTVKSTAFELQLQQRNYMFTGQGLGHGVGLCQYGAMGMAQQRHSYRKILQHYFPGTIIKNDPALGELQTGH